jgi:excisionase family DNA binding protein
MLYTLGTAAKATGKSKSTIHRAIKNGRISATCDEAGVYRIDPSELHRIFQPVSQTSSAEPALTQDETPNETHLLRREVELLNEERERERKQLQETISDLRHRLDEEASERRKLTLLLTHKPGDTSQIKPKKGFLSWLLEWK